MPLRQFFRKYQASILICLAAAAVCGGSLFAISKMLPQAVVIDDQDMVPLHFTDEETKPLPIPPGAISRGDTVKLPILMYHHVGYFDGKNDPVRVGLTVSPENFEAQVKWLKAQGYNSITLNNLYLLSQKKFQLPPKPIIFTFDDGYDDAFQYAVPILQKYGYTGSFGIITSFPGTHDGTNTYATWEAIAQAKDAGMEIICHTQNHFDGSSSKFDANYIYQNLTGCQQDLQNHLWVTEPFLIYPYGHYTSTYLVQAKKAGFVMGLTVHEGQVLNLENLMQLPRVRVGGTESLEYFKDVLLGIKPPVPTSATSTLLHFSE